jgi:hypothetical protein
MPPTSATINAHVERHFTGSALVRDIIIGMSDGLTVPFALAAGLSGSIGNAFVVVVAGLAEMAAGGISMGLGGYLAGRSEADTYRAELERERTEVREMPQAEVSEVRQIFAGPGRVRAPGTEPGGSRERGDVESPELGRLHDAGGARPRASPIRAGRYVAR